MKILIVAMAESIHTARWLSQFIDQGWEIYLFPSTKSGRVHPKISGVFIHYSLHNIQYYIKRLQKYLFLFPLCYIIESLTTIIIKKYHPNYQAEQLKRFIKEINPDIIHSLEIQHAGYLTLEAKKLLNDKFPPWIVTNWGSDIFLFGRLDGHKQKIIEVLSSCDFYSCECQRDAELARLFGFCGKILPIFPNTGGFDLEKISRIRQPGLISNRRLIMLKGYQGWAYRALVGLRALERCSDLLEGYTVAIYLVDPSVKIAAELFNQSTGIPIVIIPSISHEQILEYHGKARISIGINISDSISTSFLEALVMGSFPIQSNTSCANEWIKDGVTGILVPPEDPEIIEMAIRRALTNDDLVNNAAKENWKTAIEKLDLVTLKNMTIDFYRQVYNT